MEDIHRDIAEANRGADNVEIDRSEGVSLLRRFHTARDNYNDAIEAAGGDFDAVEADIYNEYRKADKSLQEWANMAEMAEHVNARRDNARSLRGLAEDPEAVAQKILAAAIEEKMEWERSIFHRGEVREAKPPILIDSDHFDVKTIDLPAGSGAKNRELPTGGKDGVAKQSIIWAPEPFHENINELMRSAAFWQGVSSDRTRQTLRDAGGDHAEFARRAMGSGDSGAWAGTMEWGTFWDLMGAGTPFFDKTFIRTIDLDATDKIPIGIINSPPAGGWLAEDGTIQLNDMGTRTDELDAHLYAVGTDISDKYLRNTWAMRLNLRGNVMRQQAAKAAYDIGIQFVNGSAGANKPTNLNGQIGATSTNKITGIVKHDELSAADLLKVTYKVDRNYRQGGVGIDRAYFVAGGDLWAEIETESGTDRRINTEGQPWVQPMITYPPMTPFAEMKHINFFLRQFACIESAGFAAPAATKTDALWFGCFGEGAVVRRSSVFQAMIPISVMIGGQTKIQERLVHWIYVDIGETQNTTLSGKAGPLTVVQPNRT